MSQIRPDHLPDSPLPTTEFDVVILGGGLVGSSLACALAPLGLRIAVIESMAHEAGRPPRVDERVLALSLGTRRILDGMGVWQSVADEAEPIEQVHVSDRGHCAMTRIRAEEEQVEALGYVVPAHPLGQAIQQGLQQTDVTSFCPARLTELRQEADHVALTLEHRGRLQPVHARLLVGADGTHSALRERLQMRSFGHEYGLDAVITTVMPDRPQPRVAFERFTDTGPLAMLPMTGGRYSVVWSCRNEETSELLTCSEADFLTRLQERFGYRLGRLEQLGSRVSFPLQLLLVPRPVRDRVVLIGNAAHTMHPVAGQGFNLGLRDVAALAEAIASTWPDQRDPGSAGTLDAYRRWRGRDQEQTGRLTDLLVRTFSNPLAPVRLGRTLALCGLELTPSLRHLLARRFMGLQGRQPRLACGLSLGVNP